MRARVAIALAAIAAVAVWMRRPDSTPGVRLAAPPITTLVHTGSRPVLEPVVDPVAESAPPANRELSIRGRVVRRGTHEPVARVVVVGRGTTSRGLDRIVATTDDDGHFVLSGSSTHYDLAVESAGWFGRASIDAGSVDEIVIEATEGAAVAGRVEGACAVVLRSETSGMRASGVGAIRFAAVPAGDYLVHISCGMRSSDTALHVDDRALDADWRIDPGLAIAGRVVDPGGVSVPHAVVAFEGRDRVVDTRADDDGRFELSGLDDGVYAIAVVSGDRRTLSAQLDVRAGTRDVSIVTTASGALHGQADRTTDAMTAFATGDDGIVAAASIRADGTFAFDDLAPGAQRIVICDPSAGEVGASTAVVEVGRATDVHVTAHASAVVPAGDSPCVVSAGEVAIATPR